MPGTLNPLAPSFWSDLRAYAQNKWANLAPGYWSGHNQFAGVPLTADQIEQTIDQAAHDVMRASAGKLSYAQARAKVGPAIRQIAQIHNDAAARMTPLEALGTPAGSNPLLWLGLGIGALLLWKASR